MALNTSTLGRLAVELFVKDSGFRKGLSRASADLSKAGLGMRDFANVVRNQVGTALKIGAASMAAFATASTVVGATFEAQMAKVAAISGATGDDFDALTEQARKLGASTEFTATQAGEALEALARAGLTVKESLNASSSALLLASTSGAELGESANLIAATMRQFGLDAEDSTRIMDVFSKAMRSSLLDFSSIREAMKFAGTAGASFGMTLEETTAAIAAFRNLGLEGSLAGTNFRMAMIAAANGSGKAEAALKKYGLTLADINPETHTFQQILVQIADAGLTATDSIKIFGARAGANVAQLAAQVRTGELDIVGLTEKLQESAGETADMYATIGDTVAFQAKIVVSAMQDLMIETFGTFQGPLLELIKVIPEVLNEASSALKAQAGGIGSTIKSTLADLTSFIRDNKTQIADSFVTMVRLSADLAGALEPVLKIFVWLIGRAETLGLLLGTIFVAATGAAIGLSSGFSALAGAVGLAEVSVVAFGTTLTVTTGGLFALVTAVGAVVAAIAIYVGKVRSARNETELLRAAQERLTAEQEAVAASEEQRLAPILEQQQERARKLLETSSDLTDAQRRRLEAVLSLTAESARLAMQEGQLVESGGELVTIEGLLARGGADAAAVIKSQADAADGAAQAAGNLIASLQDNIRAYEQASSATARAAELQVIATKLGRDDIATMQDARAVLAELGATRQAEATRAKNLRDGVAKALRKAVTEERAVELQADRARAQSAKQTADAVISERERVKDATQDIVTDLRDELAQIGLDQVEQERFASAKRREEINRSFEAQIAAEQAHGERLLELRREQEEALRLASEIEARKTREVVMREQMQLAMGVLMSHKITATEVQKIEMVRAKVLGKISEVSAETRAKVEQAFADQIAEARARAEQGAQDKILEVLGRGLTERQQIERERQEAMAEFADASAETRAALEEAFGRRIRQAIRENVIDSIKGAVTAVADFGSGMVQAAKTGIGAMEGLLGSFTGFSFDLRSIVEDAFGSAQDAADAARDAALEAGASNEEAARVAQETLENFDFAGAAIGFVEELAANASVFASALAESVGPIIQALADALPGLLATVVEQIPVVVEAIVAQIPQIVEALISAVPALVGALTEALVAVIDIVPEVLRKILEGLPDIITALAEAVPVVLSAIVQAVPQILQAVIDNLPAVINAIIDAVPVILRAVFEAVPQIVTSVIEAIPDIVAALVEAIPTLVQMVLELLPDLILALVRAVPMLFQAIVEAMPQIIVAIVGMLPDLISALLAGLFGPDGIVAMLPELISAVVGGLFALVFQGIPTLIGQLVDALFFELPAQMIQFVGDSVAVFFSEFIPAGIAAIGGFVDQLFTELIPGMFEAIREWVPEALRALGDGIVEVAEKFGAAVVDVLTLGLGGAGKKAPSERKGAGKVTGAISDALGAIGTGIKGLFGGGAFTGMDFVPATMRLTVHKGEAVVPADRNAARLAGGAGPAPAGAAQQFGAMPGIGGGVTQIVVMAEGRVLDAVQVRATAQGRATGVARSIRRATGVDIGFDRGNFNRWT